MWICLIPNVILFLNHYATHLKVYIYISVYIYDGFPGWLSGKQSACNAEATGATGLIPGLGRSIGRGNGNPLQYSCLRIPWTEEPVVLQSIGLQRSGHD